MQVLVSSVDAYVGQAAVMITDSDSISQEGQPVLIENLGDEQGVGQVAIELAPGVGVCKVCTLTHEDIFDCFQQVELHSTLH